MAGRIPKAFIDQLLTRIDIVDVIQTRVPLKKAGREFTACCPFHGEKTPSFSVSPSKQFYHCFGCGAHGSAITFLMEYDHMEYTEAIETLARHLGLEVPRETTSQKSFAASKRPQHEQTTYNLLDEVRTFYQDHLSKAASARTYLQKRGLSDVVIQQFALGYAPDSWDAVGKRFVGRFTQKQLLDSGLQLANASGRIYDRFRGRLMFPIRDRRGRTVGFGGRVLDDSTPKYLNSPETELFHKGSELYGFYEARQNTRHLKRWLVVEGYMDVIALAQYGITYSVATLGTATTQEHVRTLFQGVAEIVFSFDGDRAGRNAAWKALEVILPELRDDRKVKFLFLPQGEDPDSQIRKVGKEGFEQAIHKAQALSTFFIDGLVDKLGFEFESVATLNTVEDGVKFATEAKRLLALMPAIHLKTHLLREVQRRSQVVFEQQGKSIKTFSAKVHSNGEFKAGRWQEAKPVLGVIPQHSRDFEVKKTPVRYAITLLMHSPSLASSVGNPEKLLEWNLPGMDLLAHLVEIIEEYPHIHSAALLEHFRGTVHEQVLLKLMQWQPNESEEGLLLREFEDCLCQIRRQAHQKALDKLLHKEQTEGLTFQEKHDLLSLLHDIHNVAG
ncbi:MAG: DNA primase [Proteobacteria bacterium]|nr:MAG: DNA primase [Pseudomonadota bacterium]